MTMRGGQERADRHQGVAAADLPYEGNIGSFDGATGWLNSQPLTPSGLRGHVAVVQFWTYTCIGQSPLQLTIGYRGSDGSGGVVMAQWPDASPTGAQPTSGIVHQRSPFPVDDTVDRLTETGQLQPPGRRQ